MAPLLCNQKKFTCSSKDPAQPKINKIKKKKDRSPVCFHLNRVQSQGLFAGSKIVKEWAASDLLFYHPRCVASIMWSQGCWILRGLCTFAWNNIVGLGQFYLDFKWPDHQWHLDVTEWCLCHYTASDSSTLEPKTSAKHLLLSLPAVH